MSSLLQPRAPRPDTATRGDLEDVEEPFKLTLNIPTGLHRRLKMACAGAGLSMTDVLSELIRGWLQGQKG